jgi:NAD(P)-dependent dehydrogenase (short-subunit alcohol dehydrogenase family)
MSDERGAMSTVVMTGATSGIGSVAISHIAARPGTRVLIGARGSQRRAPTGVEVLPLDLASLTSVRTFAEAVKRRLGDHPIDMLVLNAGAQWPDVSRRSADGYELTFAVNHLAHYLLARLLLPSMARGGRLVITTSDTHDPAAFPLAPQAMEPQAFAHPTKSGFGSGVRAYAASKLCNLLTARSLRTCDEVSARGVTVVAYNPSLTAGTQLSRAQPRLMALLLHGMLKVLGVFISRFRANSVERAGQALAELTLGTVTPPPGRVYASLVKDEVTFPSPSALALSDEARDRLWRESAVMTGTP